MIANVEAGVSGTVGIAFRSRRGIVVGRETIFLFVIVNDGLNFCILFKDTVEKRGVQRCLFTAGDDGSRLVVDALNKYSAVELLFAPSGRYETGNASSADGDGTEDVTSLDFYELVAVLFNKLVDLLTNRQGGGTLYACHCSVVLVLYQCLDKEW